MSGNIIFACLVAMTMLFFAKTVFGQHESRNSTRDRTSIFVQSNDVVGIDIQKTANRQWVEYIDATGKPRGTYGVVQEVEVQGVKARIHYAGFASAGEAHQAAEFHIKNVASIFKTGLWDGVQRQLIGDEIWSSRHAETLAVLVRAGKICVLISCHGGDTEKRERVAEMLAERIVQKAGKGARVPLPESP